MHCVQICLQIYKKTSKRISVIHVVNMPIYIHFFCPAWCVFEDMEASSLGLAPEATEATGALGQAQFGGIGKAM